MPSSSSQSSSPTPTAPVDSLSASAASTSTAARPIMSRSSSISGSIRGLVTDYWENDSERPDWMGAFTLLGALAVELPSRALSPSLTRTSLARSPQTSSKVRPFFNLPLIRQFSGLHVPPSRPAFFDSRLDLIERRLKAHSDRLKNRAGEVLSKSSANLR